MKSTTVSAIGLAAIGSAQAAAISARQASFDFTCNGKQNPDVDDCADVYAIFSDPTQTFSAPAQPNNYLWFNAGESKNCQIDIYFYDRSYVVTGNQVYNGIDGVRNTCFPQRTGGSANDIGNRYSIEVRNNPSFVTPGTTKRDTPRVIGQGVTIERERSTSVTTSVSLGKRADSDTGFTYGVHTTYAKEPAFRTDIDVGLAGKSQWEWNESKSVENTASLTMEVSAGIEGMLSTTLGTTISTTRSTTSGTAQTLNVECENNQVGTVYFQAYTQIWKGSLQPSGELLTVTAPMRLPNGETDGFYAWECSNI